MLQPINPSHPPALRAVADALLARLPAANPGLTFDVRQDDRPITPPAHPSKYQRHATVRNAMLDTYLRPHHDAVLWVDSDLVDYPADLPTRLAELGGIAAPFVLLEPSPLGSDRYYDIGGFVEAGRRFSMHAPYCTQPGPVVELDSVGCLYLAPAALYRDGVRYAPPPTDYYVEHWSVMRQAAARGIPIRARRDVVARHAYLPRFGLELN